jgi:hypothetical protein
MLMPPITARLSVEDGQYWITDMDPDVEFELPEPGGASGLAGVAGNLAVVLTGTQFGTVSVTVQAGDTDPGLDAGPWEEVVECSLRCGPGRQPLGITSGGQGADSLQGLTRTGAESFRLRIHARGRAAGAERDVVTGTPVEEHLVQVWPAPLAADRVLKTAGDRGPHSPPATDDDAPRFPTGSSTDLHLNEPILVSDRAVAMLKMIEVHQAGATLWVQVTVDVSGLRAREQRRARHAVEGDDGVTFPGLTDPGKLRLRLRYADGRSTDFDSPHPYDLPAAGPAIWPCGFTNYPDGESQVAEQGFWTWPLPPPGPLTLTLDWPAVGIPPSSITIDGTAIAQAAQHISKPR